MGGFQCSVCLHQHQRRVPRLSVYEPVTGRACPPPAPPDSPPPSLCLKACITEKRKGWGVVIVTTLQLFSRALVATDLAESCGVCVKRGGFGLGRVQFPVILVQNATQTNPSLTAGWEL